MPIQTLSDVLAQRGAEQNQSQLSQIQQASGLAGLMDALRKRKQEEVQAAQGQEFAGQFTGNDQGSQALKFLASQPGGAQIVAKLLAEQKMKQDLYAQEYSQIQKAGQPQGQPTLQAVAPTQGQPLGNKIDPQAELAGITDPAQRQALEQVIAAEKQDVQASASVAPKQANTIFGWDENQAALAAGSQNQSIAAKGKLIANEFSKRNAQQERSADRAANREDAQANRRSDIEFQQTFVKSQAEQAALDRSALQRTAAANRPEPAPIQLTDAAGNVKLVDRSGNLIKDLGNVGKPTATFEKAKSSQKKLGSELSTAIRELTEITKDGGLIDQSTGSGAGAGVDWAADFVGVATPGSIAVGQLKPIYDLVLKMVPRFEGPQSDKDTASYEKAAGQIANPKIPNPTKKAAAKEILRLMQDRNNKFISKDIAGTEFESSVEPLAATSPTQDKKAAPIPIQDKKTEYNDYLSAVKEAGTNKEIRAKIDARARERGVIK